MTAEEERKKMTVQETILVVEDDLTNPFLFRELLEARSYRVLEAPEGAAAIDLACAARSDFILMDLQLPGVDGFEAARRLKADGATRAIPVVAITAMAMPGDEERARAAGCDGYISIPIDIPTFISEVEGYLTFQQRDPAMAEGCPPNPPAARYEP